jgi:hypothetical protein
LLKSKMTTLIWLMPNNVVKCAIRISTFFLLLLLLPPSLSTTIHTTSYYNPLVLHSLTMLVTDTRSVLDPPVTPPFCSSTASPIESQQANSFIHVSEWSGYHQDMIRFETVGMGIHSCFHCSQRRNLIVSKIEREKTYTPTLDQSQLCLLTQQEHARSYR